MIPGDAGSLAEWDVVIETPKGSRNKYELDPASGRIRLDRMLFTSTRFPFDYGYLPASRAEDGEPLDVLVLGEDPAFPGCVIRVRPVAVFWMLDEAGPDAKILAAPAHDPRLAAITDLPDVPHHLLAEIGHFFDIYKSLEPGKSGDARGWQDRSQAEEVIATALHYGAVF